MWGGSSCPSRPASDSLEIVLIYKYYTCIECLHVCVLCVDVHVCMEMCLSVFVCVCILYVCVIVHVKQLNQ